MVYIRDVRSCAAAHLFYLIWISHGNPSPVCQCHINEVTMLGPSLGEVESRHQKKAVRAVPQIASVSWSNSAHMHVTRTQMWSDLLGAGVDLTNIDR